MTVIALDTETCLIGPAQMAPPMVCLTWQRRGEEAGIAHVSTSEPIIASWLAGSDTLVGQNVAYDMGVICEQFPALTSAVFAAYDNDRITDTKTRQQLLDIAGGVYRGRFGERGVWRKHEYSLDALAKRLCGMQLAKDGWRMSYGEFLRTELTQWPTRAREVQAAARNRLEAAALLAVRHLGGAAQGWREGDDEDSRRQREGDDEDSRRHDEALVASDPEQCIKYPLDDARATLAVFEKQEVHRAYLADQYRQARADFWLHLSSAWGLRTDADGVSTLREQTELAYAAVEGDLIEAGLVRPNGTRDTKAAKARMIAVCRAAGLPLRRTDAHGPNAKCKGEESCEEHVCLDADACNATEDDLLVDYAEISTLKKVLSNDVKALEQGTRLPVHTRYGRAETGRTTSSKPNIQNLRRLEGIREAFVPRPGKVFAQADYPQLELYTLAQCCKSWLGMSKLADALNQGLDPHLAMAAQILGLDYAEAKANIKRADVDAARQTAKVANFGFPGGLGIAKLVLFAKKTYRVDLSLDRAKELKAQWFATWPEMPHYFARVNALCDTPTGFATVKTLFTERTRGGATYCAACNNGFQALGSDCAKAAGWLIAKEQYVGSPPGQGALFGTRTVAFVHDEFILEVPDDRRAHDAARALAAKMVEGANQYLPDVPIPISKLEPLLMRRWSKKAKPVHDSEGRLVPWQ